MRERLVTAWILIVCNIFLIIFFPLAAPAGENQQAEGEKQPMAAIETDKGTIKIKLFPDKAPITVTNFIALAGSGFYDGLTFHRYVPGFVIQGGDPEGDGTGGPGYTIQDEHDNGLRHYKGAVAMARTNEPDSAGSQFYICLNSAHELDGKYTVFGQVVEGMDVVLQLREGDVMKRVRIEK